MKTEDELKEKLELLKAMGSPSALSKAREIEWVLGLEEEPDEESDAIVDTLMKNHTPVTLLVEQIPEFARDHMMYKFWKQGDPIKVKKPDDWDETIRGKWDEETAKEIREWELKVGKGRAFSWKDLLGRDGFKELSKKIQKKTDKDGYEAGFYTKVPDEATNVESAELIASLTKKGTHRPLLDLDIPAVVVPSTTPGHGHLYIDKELSWKDYKKLLNVLADLDIIEHGYRGASIARGYSALRLPWIKKEQVEKDIIKTFA